MLPFAMYFYHDLWIISIREYIVDSFSKTFRDAVLEMFHTCVNVWIQVPGIYNMGIKCYDIGIQ